MPEPRLRGYASHHQGRCNYVRRCLTHDARVPDDMLRTQHERRTEGPHEYALICESGEVRRVS